MPLVAVQIKIHASGVKSQMNRDFVLARLALPLVSSSGN
jgi:hypothetical protein